MKQQQLRFAIAAVAIVALPFVIEAWLLKLPPVFVATLWPGVHAADAVFNLAGWPAFDYAGDLTDMFAAGMVLLSILFWFALLNFTSALCHSIRRRMNYRVTG
jgi:hypothetical protein